MAGKFRTAPAVALVLILAACGAPAPAPQDGAAADVPAAAPEPPPPATIPRRFQGQWDRSAAACAGAGSAMRLVVAADRLEFHESVARVEAVRPLPGGGISLDLVFTGEGATWPETRTFALGRDDRLVVTARAEETARHRCGGFASEGGRDWRAAASGEGDALYLTKAGARRITLFCSAWSDDLLVNIPAFTPVGSEERMTFGSAATLVTLVADPAGDSGRGGVSGTGSVPAELDVILADPAGIHVNYGAQDAGPFPTPPHGLASAFLRGCRD